MLRRDIIYLSFHCLFMKSLQRTIRISDQLWDRVNEAARQDGVSASEFVRTAIVERLSKHKEALIFA